MIEIGQGFILHPENVQAGFVPLQDFLDRESSEAPVRVIRGPGLHAIVAVLGVIAADKVLQIGIGHRVLLECKVNVGSEIIYPDLLRLHLRAGRTLVEEQHIRLDARLIEYARGQPQNGVKIRGFQQLFADVSPAPPSNSTLSGTTTAALPVAFRMVLICWMKFSCLLELVVQKSWRL